MSRLLSLPLILITLGLLACERSSGPERIFLVTIDTLRADHLSLYGYPRQTSAFLDSLGERGLVFETAFASCAHTAPSHASLFTALHPPQHRLLRNGEKLNDTVVSLAELLRDQGYRTAAFTAVGFLEGVQAGFEEVWNATEYQPAPTILGQAQQWIRSRGRDEKLFVWIHLFDVHEWSYAERRDLQEIKKQNKLRGAALLDHLAREHGTNIELKPESFLKAVNSYDAQILATDRALRGFFEALQAEKLAHQAVWIVTSDHGEGLANHDFMRHGKTVYDEQIRVPLLFYFADQRFAPRRVKGLVQLVDVAATVAELAGVSFDGQIIAPAGSSLMPLIRDPDHAWHVKAVFANRRPANENRLRKGWLPGDVFALRTERHKVIGHSGGQHEIYDLTNDPFELRNLIDEPSAEQQRLLKALLRQYSAMVKQGEHIGSGEIDPKHTEELKAFGYL